MKRLLAQIGLTYLSVLIVVFYFGTISAVVISALSAVCFAVFICIKKFRRTVYLPVMSAVALTACIVNVLYTSLVYNKIVDTYAEKSISVKAVLSEEPYKNYDTNYYLFDTISVNDSECDFSFMLYSYDELNVQPFDVVDMTLTLKASSSTQNIAKGYFLSAFADTNKLKYTVCSPDKKPLKYYVFCIRDYVRNALDSTLSDNASSLSKALFIGDRYALGSDVRTQFVNSGVSYLIVVSGLHFSILFSLLLLLADFLARRLKFHKHLKCFKNLAYYILIALCVFYMVFSGMTSSVFRSGIMFILAIIASKISRQKYTLNCIGVAAIIITVFSGPYIAGDASLILSFSSVIAIVELQPYLYSKLCIKPKHNYNIISEETRVVDKAKILIKKILLKTANIIIGLISVNLSSLVVSVMVSVLLFHSFSTMSLVAGILLYPAIWVILLSAFVISLLYYIPILSYVTTPIAFVSNILSEYTLKVVAFVSDFPFSYIYANETYVYIWIIFTVVLVLIAFMSKLRSQMLRLTAMLSAIVLLSGFAVNTIRTYTTPTLDIYNVSNDMAVVYKYGETADVLVLDCSPYNSAFVINNLSNGITKVNFCSSVFNTQKSYQSLISLKEEFAINTVLLYDTVRSVHTADLANKVQSPTKTTVLRLCDSDFATYTKVGKKYIITVQIADKSVLILPNNISIKAIPSNMRSADYIVLSSCPDDYELLSCDTLVISAQKDKSVDIGNICHDICNNVLYTANSDITTIK